MLKFFCAEMMTKFNKDMYAKIKGKKNEPLSSIGQRRLKIVDKEKENEKETVERGSSTPTLDEGRATSPTLSIEEVVLLAKRRKTGDKGKEKLGSNVWDNVGAAMAKANELLTLEEMREISNMPSHEMVSQHVHKLVQVIFFFFFVLSCLVTSTDLGHDKTFCCQVLGETMHITSQYLANEEKAIMANSKVEALEAEASRLRSDLIATMDANNTSKEQIKVLIEQLDSERLLLQQKDDLLASVG